MRQLYERLGDKQKRTLLSPDMKQKMDMFSRLTGMNDHALNRMANPKTGAQVLVPMIEKFLMGAGAVGGGIAGGPTGTALGLVAAPAIGGATARYFNKLLTSPKKREEMVQAIINGSKNEGRLKIGGEVLKGAILPALLGQ